MDNVCHTLAGAVFGEAGLKSRTRFGSPILMIASNLPDVDIVAFATATPAVALRRGWTHGVLAQALLPIVLTAAVVLVDRVWPGRSGPRLRPAQVLLLGYVGVLSHVFLDWLNSYGIRLLMPFSNRWFYGDAMFIVDPWLWMLFLGGVLVARRRQSVAPARIALAVAAIYIGAMVWSAAAARERVLDAWVDRRGQAPRALMVGPVPVTPFRRAIVVDAGDRYVRGVFTWWPARIDFDGGEVLKQDTHPAVLRARAHPDFRAILLWARFPHYEVIPSPAGTDVRLRDVRFGARVGAASVTVD
jgi:inner membrane protein